MRAGATHHRALIFENLDIGISGGKLCFLRGPRVDQYADIAQWHFRQGFAMVGRKANDSTGSIGKSRTKQGFVFFYSTGCAGHQCGKVIVENEDIFVIRIA